MGTKSHVPGPGWTPHKTLVLPISPEQWELPEEPVEVDGITFQPKRELHVTLIGRGLGQALHTDPARRQAVREAFMRLDWSFSRTGQLLRLEKRELPGSAGGRAIGAIIERIEMPAMAQFYDAIAGLLERGLAIPPAHVTLYTAGTSQGIGVPDVATLNRLTVHQIPAPTRPRDRPHARH